jgi:CxxC motif-containing protein (DUF1111 family)
LEQTSRLWCAVTNDRRRGSFCAPYAAIRAHDGQAAAAENAFNARSSTDQHDLVAFLLSL